MFIDQNNVTNTFSSPNFTTPVTGSPVSQNNESIPTLTSVPATQPDEVTSRYHSKFQNNVCNFTACVEPRCQCLNDKPPGGLLPEQIPQFVTITFDGAVTVTNFPFYKDLFKYKNPSDCQISATYFVSHVDTNYKLVHELHRHGNEIAVHSIRYVVVVAGAALITAP